jgi:ABC-type multidrug transport system fused ATPase/permease subunit
MQNAKGGESKAALPPGTMNPAAVEPWEEIPVHSAGGVPYRKLFRWGWSVVSAARGWFFFGTILPMVRQLLEKYNIQALATLITGLGGTAAMTGGFLAPFLPDQPRAAAIIFAFLTLFLILLGFLDRLTLTWSNNLMAVRLQQRLHDKLLDLGPTYHHSHDLGETMLIVTRFSSPTQILLRDLISFPVVRGVGLITAIIFLANSFSMMGDPPSGFRGPCWLLSLSCR